MNNAVLMQQNTCQEASALLFPSNNEIPFSYRSSLLYSISRHRLNGQTFFFLLSTHLLFCPDLLLQVFVTRCRRDAVTCTKGVFFKDEYTVYLCSVSFFPPRIDSLHVTGKSCMEVYWHCHTHTYTRLYTHIISNDTYRTLKISLIHQKDISVS